MWAPVGCRRMLVRIDVTFEGNECYFSTRVMRDLRYFGWNERRLPIYIGASS